MSNWFYYDNNGQKQGPVTGGQIKELAKAGTISPDTIIETEEGKSAPARKVKGLTFSQKTTCSVSLPSQHVSQEPIAVPFPVKNSKESQIENPSPHTEKPNPAYALSILGLLLVSIICLTVGLLSGDAVFLGVGCILFLISFGFLVKVGASVTRPSTVNGLQGTVFTLDGVGGRLLVHEDKIEILRSESDVWMHGFKGNKTLYYHSITALQMLKGGATNGYIQFSILGGNESKGGIWAATSDENTIMFSKDKNEIAQKIHDYIERKLLESHNPKSVSSVSQSSSIDEIKKMKELLDIGAVSQEEFDAFKKKTLGL